jgi:penicillin-binding protein 1A
MPETGDFIREGERLQGVVLGVRDSGATVAIKHTQGILPPAGYAWVRHIDPALKVDLRRQMLRRGDVIQVRVTKVDPAGKAHTLALDPDPLVQGALVAMDVGSGHVLAMVGGYDFMKSQFNRAVQALRQPGSSFKPLVYAAALEDGMTPVSTVLDAPLTIDLPGGKGWRPDNYDGKYYGPMTLRSALAQSRNLVTVRLLEKVGAPTVCATAKRLGITTPFRCYPSIALGAAGLTLMELTAAYGTFANGGVYNEPLVITKIVDRKGKVLLERYQEARQATSPEVAYLMTSMMESVVKHGTGRIVRGLERPAAGKTGTTNDFNDAWFVGYTPELVTGVWVGRDDHESLGDGETGGKVAAPIWLEFMKQAMQDRPVTDFPIPPGIRFVRLEGRGGTNTPTAMSFADESVQFEAFIEGSQPKTIGAPRKKPPPSGTPAPTDQPPDDLRRDLDRLDRQQSAGAAHGN